MATSEVVTGEQKVIAPTPEEILEYGDKSAEAWRQFRSGKVPRKVWHKALQMIIEGRQIELSKSQLQAQAELGQDFITPEEAAKYLGYTLTDEDIAGLSELKLRSGRVLTLDDLRREKGKRVLHPVLPVSVLEMRERFGVDPEKQPCFREKQDQYLNLRQTEFASAKPLKPYWNFIAKDAKEDSFDTSWDNQEKLLSSAERRTMALEVGQAAFQYFQKTGIRLYRDFYAWCSDAHGEFRVNAGYFIEDGFNFYCIHLGYVWHLHGLVLSLE